MNSIRLYILETSSAQWKDLENVAAVAAVKDVTSAATNALASAIATKTKILRVEDEYQRSMGSAADKLIDYTYEKARKELESSYPEDTPQRRKIIDLALDQKMNEFTSDKDTFFNELYTTRDAKLAELNRRLGNANVMSDKVGTIKELITGVLDVTLIFKNVLENKKIKESKIRDISQLSKDLNMSQMEAEKALKDLEQKLKDFKEDLSLEEGFSGILKKINKSIAFIKEKLASSYKLLKNIKK